MAQLSKPKNVTAWVISALLAVLYVAMAGWPKVEGAQEVVDGFARYGYSEGFRLFIGICEIAGGIGLLIPRLATWAAAGLICIMAGATYTHLTQGESPVFPIILAGLLALVAYLRLPQALFVGRARANAASLQRSERADRAA